MRSPPPLRLANWWPVCLLLIVYVQGERLKNTIYKDMTAGFYACFRRTNGTHQFGCTSDENGNVGVVHLATTWDDITWLMENGPHEPYMVIFTPKMFTFDAVNALKGSGKASGVILLPPNSVEGTDIPEQGSDDLVCPNSVPSLYGSSSCSRNDPWNPAGSGMLHHDWPFPVVMVNDGELAKFLVEDCYRKFNQPFGSGEPPSWPLCAVELNTFMNQAVDTTTCLRRNEMRNILSFSSSNFCDKMGDKSVFMLHRPPDQKPTETYPTDSIIMVTARLDAFSMFDHAEIGSDTPSTGIAVLLAAAKLLSQELSSSEPFRDGVSNILYTFLNGESFDYIGSSRLVYDMANGNFPPLLTDKDSDREQQLEVDGKRWPLVKPDSLKMVLELGQLYSKTEELFAHVDSKFTSIELQQDLKKFFKVPLTEASKKTRGLPPASLQSLLKHRREIPGILVANFDQTYSNRYYHGVYDNFTLLEVFNYASGPNQPLVELLSKVSESVAAFIYHQATGSVPSKDRFVLDRSLMNDILHCYMETSRCRLFNESSTADTPPNYANSVLGPYPQYVGVTAGTTYHSIMTQRLLTYFTGTPVPDMSLKTCTTTTATTKEGEGQNVYQRFYVKGKHPDCVLVDDADCGMCLQTTSSMYSAVSPAFVIEGYDYSNSTYGSWAESSWKEFKGRVFMKGDPSLDMVYLWMGIVITLIASLVSWWGQKKCDLIFEADDAQAQGRFSNSRYSTGAQANVGGNNLSGL